MSSLIKEWIKITDSLYVTFYSLMFVISAIVITAGANLAELSVLNWIVFIFNSIIMILSIMGIAMILVSWKKKTRTESYFFAWLAFYILACLTAIELIVLIVENTELEPSLFIGIHLVTCILVFFRIFMLKLLKRGDA